MVWFVFGFLGISHAQITIAFQGAETGDTWDYTTSGASADAMAQAQLASNYVSGTRAIVAGGLSGGGNCGAGSGAGAVTNNIITFSEVDISGSVNFIRELSFYYGNRSPSCSNGGSGYDLGENLVFTPLHDGIPQASITIFTGLSNAPIDIQSALYTYNIPPCVTGFSFQLEIALNRNDEFLLVDDVTLSSPVVNPTSTLQCWETLSYNSSTGLCDIVGSQPPPPQSACWQTSTFDVISCAWNVTGTQPQQPVAVNCWDDYYFNETICAWENAGIQDPQPAQIHCWDQWVLNASICAWENMGVQDTEPTNLGCGLTTEFNEITCIWDLSGDIPPPPEQVNCWDNFVFDAVNCIWNNQGVPPVMPVTTCYETAIFQATSCEWIVTGTQPLPPSTACYESAQFDDASCSWIVTGTQPLQPQTECWQSAVFNHSTCVWDISGAQPQPPNSECYESVQFDDASCSWIVTGTQPIQPQTECWQSAVFNHSTCVWDITGLSPIEPSTACYETAEFDPLTCAWYISGEQPQQPEVECYENAFFDDISCSWIITGSPFSIHIEAFPWSAYAPLSTTLSLSYGAVYLSAEWWVNGLPQGDSESLGYTFLEDGSYEVIATAMSSGGCWGSDTLRFTLEEFTSQLLVPNSFTPNFDGHNDFFTVTAEHIAQFEMRIYSRWGELLFDSRSMNPGWNGYSENDLAYPDGTYVYIIKALGQDGKVYEKSGSVTLVR
jgi:gliding motility-associated-like protein